MTRLEHLAEGLARLDAARGSTTVGLPAAAQGGTDGQSFLALLQDLARPAPGKDRRGAEAADDGAAERGIEDGAPHGRDDRPTDTGADTLVADVARLLFAGSASGPEPLPVDGSGGEQERGAARREAGDTDPRREIAVEPARLPKAQVLARETHFAPVDRPAALNPPSTARGLHGLADREPNDEAGRAAAPAPERPVTTKPGRVVGADRAATQAPLAASDGGRGSLSGTVSRAPGGSLASNLSLPDAVAADPRNDTATLPPMVPAGQKRVVGADRAAAEVTRPASDTGRSSTSINVARATGDPSAPDPSRPDAVAAAPRNDTAAKPPVFSDAPPPAAAVRTAGANGSAATEPHESFVAAGRGAHGDEVDGRSASGPEADPARLGERRPAGATDASGDRDLDGGSAAAGERRAPSPPSAATSHPAEFARPASTPPRRAGAIPAETRALATAPSSFGEPLTASRPVAGGPVDDLVPSLQPETLGTPLRATGGALASDLWPPDAVDAAPRDDTAAKPPVADAPRPPAAVSSGAAPRDIPTGLRSSLVAAETPALATAPSPFGQPPAASRPVAGGPVDDFVTRLPPETLGTPLRATGGSSASDPSPPDAVAAAPRDDTAARPPVFSDTLPPTAAVRTGGALRSVPAEPHPTLVVADTGAHGDEVDGRSARGPETDPVGRGERRASSAADASGHSVLDGRSATAGERRAPSPPGAATVDPTGLTLPASTLPRLAGAIAAEARAFTTAPPSFDQPPAGPRAAAGGPVKILVLRLQPETLGTVTVRLRLVGNALELQLQAASSETAELLQRDRAVLEDCLKASGYETDLTTIQTVARDAARPQADQTGTQSNSGRQDPAADSGFRQGGGEQPQGRGGEADDRPRRPDLSIRTREPNDETLGQGDRAGGLYL
jgi:hypothetical protein